MPATVAATMSEADCNNDAARRLEAAIRELRTVAAAALREALHQSYRHAVETYGMVLVQWTRQISRLQEEVMWRILTFASDVPQLAEKLGISKLSRAVTGWECDVFQRQSLLRRIISVVQREYICTSSAGAGLPPQPAGYENWRPQAFPYRQQGPLPRRSWSQVFPRR